MKFLHTGDWHLGKIFYAQSLIEDQKHILNQIFDILLRAKETKNPYSAICIPGDIYDRAIPNSDATVLLNDFLTRISNEFPSLSVFILSGNHDSAKRLGFASSFLEKSNIYICSSSENIEKPIIIDNVCFYQIPFTSNLAFSLETNTSILSQNEVYTEYCKRILAAHKKYNNEKAAVLCTHTTCFNANDKNYAVGTAENVSPETFSGFDYVALGHIHKMLCINKDEPKIWYSGSPIAYSFDDTGKKGILSVEIDEKTHKVDVEQIFLNQLHPLKRIRGNFSTLDEEEFAKQWQNCYIEAECTDEKTLCNPMEILSKRYPHILSFKYAKKNRSGTSELFETRKKVLTSSASEKETMSKAFELFMKDLYGEKLEQKRFDKEKNVFDAICSEIELEEK